MRPFAMAVLLLISANVTGQPQEKKLRVMGKFEGRNSFVRTSHALFLGARIGVEFKLPIRTGIGYYWMQTEFDSQLYRPQEHPQSGSRAVPRMRYFTGYVEYTFWEEDGWSLGVPLQMGIGEAFYRTSSGDHVANGIVIPLESGVDVGYMFTRWAGLGVGIGYRFMLLDDSDVHERFNSPYYQMRVLLALNELLRRKKKSP